MSKKNVRLEYERSEYNNAVLMLKTFNITVCLYDDACVVIDGLLDKLLDRNVIFASTGGLTVLVTDSDEGVNEIVRYVEFLFGCSLINKLVDLNLNVS